ncbi:MAG: hypothetical protein L0387_19540 [Acidobacteria bacterium]|nr:hypothetical protein [Acidobacteriota bacterium]MCI0717386.1 hypothetical protein [Acidobacteriota bacterium]
MTGQSFVVPENALTLHPRAKRTVAICNLFANQHKSITEIAQLLDTATAQVISALMEEGIIADRRRYSRKQVKRERRSVPKYHLPLVWSTGNPDHLLRNLCGASGGDIVSDFVFSEVLRNDERCEECWTRYRRRGH